MGTVWAQVKNVILLLLQGNGHDFCPVMGEGLTFIFSGLLSSIKQTDYFDFKVWKYKKMVRLRRFERPTNAFGGHYSIQLSYRRNS